MQLFFLRHGHAEPAGAVNDFDRQLTEDGVARLHTATKVMQALDLRFEAIFSSPRVRAQQTAALVAEALGGTVETRDALNFTFSLGAIAGLINGMTPGARLLLVGHEPSFSTVVGDLIGGGDVIMKKGGLARVDLMSQTPPRGELVWMIAPSVFDALA